MKISFLSTKIIIILSSIFLTGCLMWNSGQVREIEEKKLDNGTTVAIGYMQVKESWNCKLLTEEKFNWTKTSVVSNGNIKKVFNPYVGLEDKAIAGANRMEEKPNYIRVYAPTSVDIVGVPLSTSKAEINYYLCESPPKKNSII
jgi:hypothetical protein